MNRTYWMCPAVNDPDAPDSYELLDMEQDSDRWVVPEPDANLVSSLLDTAVNDTTYHWPALDFDHDRRMGAAWSIARLLPKLSSEKGACWYWHPSSTEGHWHLLIDQVDLTWDEYMNLLNGLLDRKLLGEGFVGRSVARGATFLRKPGVKKPPRGARKEIAA